MTHKNIFVLLLMLLGSQKIFSSNENTVNTRKVPHSQELINPGPASRNNTAYERRQKAQLTKSRMAPLENSNTLKRYPRLGQPDLIVVNGPTVLKTVNE